MGLLITLMCLMFGAGARCEFDAPPTDIPTNPLDFTLESDST